MKQRESATRDKSTVPRRQLDAARFVLEERERELLTLKGHCSSRQCRLHYAHFGPCDTAARP